MAHKRTFKRNKIQADYPEIDDTEHVVEFLLFSCKRLCNVAFGIRFVV